jgi:uncharacterized protein YfeS
MLLPGTVGWELKPHFAHPRARALFSESFFWDGIDDCAPWGSDEGADALAAFGRSHLPDGSPPNMMEFTRQYVGWNWSPERITVDADEATLSAYSSAHLAVIAIALGAYLLHGYVPHELKQLGLEAIDRELQPNCYLQFGFPQERIRKLGICRDRLWRAETRKE